MNGKLTIVVPAFNEEANIEPMARETLRVCRDAGIPCELLFVSDGSTDGTFGEIRRLAESQTGVRGIELSRNFGKEACILAGLAAGQGDCFIVMDCDLQHPPQCIPEMYHLWQEGYEIVEGVKRQDRRSGPLHRLGAGMFYGVLSFLTGYDLRETSDFKLLDARVARTLVSLPERRTFFRALTFWTGFRSCPVHYDVAQRRRGRSKWSPLALLRYAANNIIAFSAAPLSLVTLVGGIALLFSLVLGLQTLVRYFSGNAVEGFTTVILLILILGGCILIGLGLIGRYIAAIYEEVKHRPRYLIQQQTDEPSAAPENTPSTGDTPHD